MTKKRLRLRIGLVRFCASWFDRIGHRKFQESTPDHTAALCAYLEKSYVLIDTGTAKTPLQGAEAATRLRAAAADLALVVLPAWSDDESLLAFLHAVSPTPVWFADVGSYVDIPSGVSKQAAFFAHTELVGLLQATATAKRATGGARILKWRADPTPASCPLAIACAALDASKRVSSQVIGVLPSRATEVRCASVDELALAKTVGCRLNYISVGELARAFERVPARSVNNYIRQLLRYKQTKEGFSEDAFRQSAKLACALSSLAEERLLGAIAFDDSSPELHKTFQLRPCLIARELLPCCPPIALEGDIGAAAVMLIMEQMGSSASALVEPFFIDKKSNAVLFGHAGGCDPRLGETVTTIIEPDLEYVQSDDLYKGSPSLMVTGRPGVVTLASLHVNSESKALVLLRGEVIAHKRRLPGYSEFLVRFAKPPDAIIDFMLVNGCSQHFTIAYGDLQQEIMVFADIVGLEYTEV